MNGVSNSRTARGLALAALVVLCLGIGSAHAAFPAGNGAIVYVEGGIIKGNDVTTANAGNNPSISPNGNKVAYDSGGTLWTMDINGATAMQVPGPITGTDPSWSSDGSTLAYINASNVWTVSSAGVGATQRTNSGTASGPAFSPDGTLIAYADGATGIWTVPAGGGATHNVVGGPDSNPSWSPERHPDGVLGGRADLGRQLERHRPVAASRRGHTDTNPAWSPDGTLIALARDTGISTMTTTGLNITSVTTTAGDTQPEWRDAPTREPERADNLADDAADRGHGPLRIGRNLERLAVELQLPVVPLQRERHDLHDVDPGPELGRELHRDPSRRRLPDRRPGQRDEHRRAVRARAVAAGRDDCRPGSDDRHRKAADHQRTAEGVPRRHVREHHDWNLDRHRADHLHLPVAVLRLPDAALVRGHPLGDVQLLLADGRLHRQASPGDRDGDERLRQWEGDLRVLVPGHRRAAAEHRLAEDRRHDRGQLDAHRRHRHMDGLGADALQPTSGCGAARRGRTASRSPGRPAPRTCSRRPTTARRSCSR